MVNSRMKDFYDIYFLSNNCSFEGSKLQKAIEQTFERRETKIPTKVPIALTEDFFNDETKAKQWTAFLRRISDDQVPKDPQKVVRRIKEFLWPLSKASNEEKIGIWSSEKGWSSET